MSETSDRSLQNMRVYYGDLHNHCDLSYGHGSLEEALRNARMQLDFASVTIHAAWPDIPTDDPKLAYLVDYHHEGFKRALAGWQGYLRTIDKANTEEHFVTFPSFEWHSNQFGDHCIYYLTSEDAKIIDAPDLPAMRQALRQIATPTLLIPHHIGYKQGSRGIKWDAFTDEFSPVAEIFSFHGLSLSSEGPYPYLHSMGPVHENSTAQYGWSQGNIFGVIGSTDHHNSVPGGYGYGRLGVWSESLTRQGIWDAICARRTYALTGDRIELAFSVNDVPIGSIAPANDTRDIHVSVVGGSAIDYVDVLHNNRLIHRETVFPATAEDGIFKLYIEVGWGERDEAFDWDVELHVEAGTLRHIEPRIRNYGPTDYPPEGVDYAYTSLEALGDDGLRFVTQTRKNVSLHTPSTEGFSIEIDGHAETRIRTQINGQTYIISLRDIMNGAQTIYTGGFVSPAVCFHRAVSQNEFAKEFSFSHYQPEAKQRDWYTVCVRQHNHQYAWSSPIWVENVIK